MSRRKVTRVVPRADSAEEDRLSERMFHEYREENAKDLEREGCGEW
ncbi:MAG: hypothetical protein ABSA72_12190 [Nitrososphaerales archaeon]|jgi:hypothetical protein